MKWLALIVGAFLFTGCNPPSGDKSGDARSGTVDSRTVDEPDREGKPPIVRAVEKGAVDEVARLLSTGASVNDGWQGKPLLYLAAQQGSLEMVKLLVGKGADPKVSNTYKVTALFYASSRPVAEYLVAQGLAVDAVNTYKETPLHLAAERGNAGVVEYLLAQKANPNALANDERAAPLNHASTRKVVELLVANGAEVYGTSTSHGRVYPPICSMAWKGWAEAVAAIMDKGADVNAKTYSGSSALYGAVEKGHAEVVRVLLERGAREEDMPGNPRSPLLSIAARNGHREVAKILLDKGANPNIEREPPLVTAAANGDLPMLELLLSRGADVNLANPGGFTALHTAAGRTPLGAPKYVFQIGKNADEPKDHYLDCVRLLIRKGADSRAVSKYSQLTPLHRAAASDFAEAAELLLASGADVGAADQFSATPLHWAVINDAVATAKILLAKGADPNAALNAKATVATIRPGDPPNPFGGRAVGGQTALQLAKSKAMKDLLAKAGAKAPSP